MGTGNEERGEKKKLVHKFKTDSLDFFDILLTVHLNIFTLTL
jgi:hypothetical protein